MNEVTLIGRVGADAEIRSTNSGAKVATVRIATEERWKKDGERKSRTTWHTVETFLPGTVKFLEGFVGKGDLVMVRGILRYDEFEKDGVKQQRAKIVLAGPKHDLNILGSAKPNGSGQQAMEQSQQREEFSADLDDEIPF